MILPNLDMMVVNCDFEAYETVFGDLLELLDEKKKEAAEQMKAINSHMSIVDINGLRFQVYPNGTRGYAYVLHGEMIKLEIAKYKNAKNYPVRVMLHSEYLWSAGPKQAWKEFCLWIACIAPIARTQVSRVDLCAHTDEISWSNKLQHFKGHFTQDHLFREHRKVTGFGFGSRESKIYTRIYNKDVELKKSKKEWFRDIWQRNGATAEVWNIEFELHRDYFNELKIDLVDDFFGAITSIWRYLTEEHIVLTNKDRSRIKRSTINPVWLELQSAFDHFEGNSYIERRKIINCDAEAISAQMAGCCTSFVSKLKTGVLDIESIICEVSTAIQKHYYYKHKKSVEEVMQEKYMILQEVLGDAYFESP